MALRETFPPVGPPARSSRRARAFTLIEILAVVLIIGLVTAFVVPNLGITRGSALREDALRLAGQLELARQRAVLMRAPHRVLIDIDEGWSQLEWWKGEPDAESEAPFDPRSSLPVPLSPPRDETIDWRPVAAAYGRLNWLDDRLEYSGIQTVDGWIDGGQVGVAFYEDGGSDAYAIEIGDGEGRGIELEVRPLLDRVRIHHDDG